MRERERQQLPILTARRDLVLKKEGALVDLLVVA